MRKIAEALCNSSNCLSCYWWQGICIVFHLKFAANATLLFRCTVPTTMCLLLLYMRTKHLWIMLCPKTNNTTKKSTSNNSQGSSPQAATFPFFVVLLHLFCWDTLTKSTQAKDQRSPAGPSSPGPFPTARGDRRSAAIWQWFGNFLGFPSKDSGTKIKDWSLKHMKKNMECVDTLKGIFRISSFQSSCWVELVIFNLATCGEAIFWPGSKILELGPQTQPKTSWWVKWYIYSWQTIDLRPCVIWLMINKILHQFGLRDIYLINCHCIMFIHSQFDQLTQPPQVNSGPLKPKVAGARRDLSSHCWGYSKSWNNQENIKCCKSIESYYLSTCLYLHVSIYMSLSTCLYLSIYLSHGYCVCVFRLDVQNWIRPQVEDTTLRCASVQASTPGAPLVADGRRSALRPKVLRGFTTSLEFNHCWEAFYSKSLLPRKDLRLLLFPGETFWVPSLSSPTRFSSFPSSTRKLSGHKCPWARFCPCK